MAKWIYLSALIYVGGVLSCQSGQRLQLKNGICKFAICRGGRWYQYDCMVAASINGTDIPTQRGFNCEDGEAYGDMIETDMYYYCDHGTLVSKRCAHGEVFDKGKGMCINTSTTKEDKPLVKGIVPGDWTLELLKSDSQPEPERSRLATYAIMCDEDTLYVNVDNASMYYSCKDGSLLPQLCPDGKVFDSAEQVCISLPSNKKGVGNSLITNARKCEHGETRKKEGSCKEYYECRHGTEFIARCMDCQNYDGNEKKCRYVFDSPCHTQFPEISPTAPAVEDLTTADPSKRTSEPLPSGTTETATEIIEGSTKISHGEVSSPNPTKAGNEVSTTETAPVTKPSNSSEEGSTALPFGDCKHRRGLPDCKYYLECHEGELVTRRCGWLQYFDSLTSTCSFMGYKCFGTE